MAPKQQHLAALICCLTNFNFVMLMVIWRGLTKLFSLSPPDRERVQIDENEYAENDGREAKPMKLKRESRRSVSDLRLIDWYGSLGSRE